MSTAESFLSTSCPLVEKEGRAEIFINAADVLWMRFGGEKGSSLIPVPAPCTHYMLSFKEKKWRDDHTKISFKRFVVDSTTSSEKVPKRCLTGASYTGLGDSAEA
jgi:hypothetical protein